VGGYGSGERREAKLSGDALTGSLARPMLTLFPDAGVPDGQDGQHAKAQLAKCVKVFLSDGSVAWH
jgi:hypothetical protein